MSMCSDDNYNDDEDEDLDDMDEDDSAGDDVCDLCGSAGVRVERTTYCGLTIGIECGCDAYTHDGKCDDPNCGDCLLEGYGDNGDDYMDAAGAGIVDRVVKR